MADEDKELPELKALYDELWSDARTVIKDMKKKHFHIPLHGLRNVGFLSHNNWNCNLRLEQNTN